MKGVSKLTERKLLVAHQEHYTGSEKIVFSNYCLVQAAASTKEHGIYTLNKIRSFKYKAMKIGK